MREIECELSKIIINEGQEGQLWLELRSLESSVLAPSLETRIDYPYLRSPPIHLV